MTQTIETMIKKAKEAGAELETFNQEKIDTIVEALARVIHQEAEALAKLAVEETQMGNFPDKILKNSFKSEIINEDLKQIKSVGVIKDDKETGIVEIAEPVGVVAAIIPCTNPTVTTMIKGRNPIILAPHPRAKKTTVISAEMMVAAAKKFGLPDNAIQVIAEPSKELSQELMQKADVILATGGSAMVKAAYSSGKPSYGVGAGNVPVVIHETANIKEAIADIIKGKTFDNGLICSSEQAIIALEKQLAEIKAELKNNNAYLLSDAEQAQLKATMFDENPYLKPEVIGQSAEKIASLAGLEVPSGTKVLVVPTTGVGKAHPFSGEKMSPVLALYVVNDFAAAIALAKSLLEYQGAGHTASIHCQDKEAALKFALAMKVSRVMVNQPSSLSAGGSKFNGLTPTTTLGCGSWGGNTSSDNISVKHLINIKRLAFKLDKPRHISSLS